MVERAEDVPGLVTDHLHELGIVGGIVQQHEGIARSDPLRETEETPERIEGVCAPDVNGDELYYSLIDASDGEPQNLAGNLFDNNFDTKWCVDEDNKSGTPLADDKCWFVEFKASKPITPTGYHMVTANDHTMFPDRAPRKWSLFGLKDGWWVRLATVDNTNTDVLQMTNADKWTGNWSITEHKGEYQIFRLEMYENWGGDCFQISELGFNFQ